MVKNLSVVGIKSLLVASVLVSGSAQSVEFSAETLKTLGPVDAYWVTTVTCDDGEVAGEIRRKADGNEWCASDFDGYCTASKAETAKKVCGSEFRAAKAELQEKQKAAEQQAREKQRAEEELKRARAAEQRAERERQAALARVAAEREKAAEGDRQKRIQIDEKLLEIEQEKLSLRRQELELQKRAVEIREELESLDAG